MKKLNNLTRKNRLINKLREENMELKEPVLLLNGVLRFAKEAIKLKKEIALAKLIPGGVEHKEDAEPYIVVKPTPRSGAGLGEILKDSYESYKESEVREIFKKPANVAKLSEIRNEINFYKNKIAEPGIKDFLKDHYTMELVKLELEFEALKGGE